MITMRVSWQSGERFRIIPKRMDLEKNKLTESKLPIPSFYLGLGRLYPLGEAPDENIQKFKTKNITSEEYSWLLDNYKNILSLDTIQVNSISNYTINKKTSGGINTETYDYLTNSCGQDNIMQILYILLSFQNLYDLYKKNNKHWEGGVFLIDELDATLHPAAQIRLLHVLYDEAKKLNLQIIFTTHSLHILEFLSTHKNWKSDVCISYFTTANNTLEIKENPEYSIMKDDMMITSFYDNITPKSITVYSEDEEARWMINNLLKNYVNNLRIININLGGDSLLDLLYNDPSYFENILFILDGDKNSNSVAIKYKNLYKRYRNIVTLPSEYPPEKMIYEYLINLPDNHEILANNKGVTKRIIRDNGPNSNKYQDKIKERERYKSWWKDNIYMIEDLDIISFWIKDNKKLYDEFIENFFEIIIF